MQEKVYKTVKTRITDLDELKQRQGTKWAKMVHVVNAAAIRQWRYRLQERISCQWWTF